MQVAARTHSAEGRALLQVFARLSRRLAEATIDCAPTRSVIEDHDESETGRSAHKGYKSRRRRSSRCTFRAFDVHTTVSPSTQALITLLHTVTMTQPPGHWDQKASSAQRYFALWRFQRGLKLFQPSSQRQAIGFQCSCMGSHSGFILPGSV